MVKKTADKPKNFDQYGLHEPDVFFTIFDHLAAPYCFNLPWLLLTASGRFLGAFGNF